MEELPAAAQEETAPRGRAALAWALRLALPAAILAALFTRVDLSGIVKAIRAADPRLLAAAVLAFPLAVPIRAWRWHWLLRKFGIVYRWRETFLMFLSGFAGQFLLPTGLGDMLRLAYLVEDERPVRRSLISMLLDKLFEISGTVFFGLLGFFVLPLSLHLGRTAAPAAAALGIGAGAAFLARRRLFAAGKALLQRWLGRRVRRLAASAGADAWRDVQVLSLGEAAALLVLTLGARLLSYWSYYLLSQAMHLGFSYLQVVAIMGIIGVVVSIPGLSSSIGGLGVREGAMYALFLLLQRDGESAVAFAFLIFAVSLIWNGAAVVSWVVRPVRFGLSGRKLWAAVAQRWKDAGDEEEGISGTRGKGTRVL